MTNEHTSLEKYTSHTLFSKGLRKGCERVVWVRWVGDGTDCNILTPSSYDYSSTSFSFCWAAQPGVTEGRKPSAWSWFSLRRTATATDSNSPKLSVAPGYIIVWHSPASCGRRICTELNPSTGQGDIFDLMHLFLDWRLGRRSIYYISTPQTMILFPCVARFIFQNSKWQTKTHFRNIQMPQ